MPLMDLGAWIGSNNEVEAESEKRRKEAAQKHGR